MTYLVDCYDTSKTFIDTVEITSRASLNAIAKIAAQPSSDFKRPTVAIARIHNDKGALVDIVRLN